MTDLIHVLLIEDNPGDARLIQEMLRESGGFTLHIVGTLGEALEQTQATAFDVILLDLSLPDSLGTDTLLKARAAVPNVAIIVLTGFDDQRVGVQAVKKGAQDYLIKDYVDARLLEHAIRYAIERHRIEAELRHSEEAYRSLIDDVFDTSMVAVIILDQRYMVVWCNAATEVYFGIGRGQLISKDKRVLINDSLKCIFADPEAYASHLLTAYEQQHFTERFECHVLPDINRAERWLEHWSQPIRTGMYAGGRIEHYTDITNRKALEAAEREQRRFAEALLDTAEVLTSTLDPDEVLDRILANVDRVVPHDTASVTLYEAGRLQIARRRSDDKRRTQEIAAENQLQLEDIPLMRQSIKSDEAIIIADLQMEEQFQAAAAQAKVRAYAGVPILLQKKIIGYINVFDRGAHAFTQEDASRLTAFAQQSAIAIQNARIYRQSQELAAFEERQRLARELHDSVSQTLFTSSAMAESALRRWDKDLRRSHELLEEVHHLTITALSQMRILLLELRPESLIKVSLQQLFTQYLEPIQSRRGFKLEMQIDDGPPLPPNVQIAVYRITQETLNNIEKHARATMVNVIVHDYSDRLELIIRDNGTGFDINQVSATSLGLEIMYERAASIDGSLHIESQVGEGTQVTLIWHKQQELTQ